jgi:hypothetical protein
MKGNVCSSVERLPKLQRATECLEQDTQVSDIEVVINVCKVSCSTFVLVSVTSPLLGWQL